MKTGVAASGNYFSKRLAGTEKGCSFAAALRETSNRATFIKKQVLEVGKKLQKFFQKKLAGMKKGCSFAAALRNTSRGIVLKEKRS